MPRPIVIAYHLMWTAYGWWLPNDPRGSTSTSIKSDVLAELGELHQGRKKIQPTGAEIRAFYRAAAPRLKFPLLTFTQRDFNSLAESFAQTIAREKYTCYAWVIMPDHVHGLIRKHKHSAEGMMANLQESSRLDSIRVGYRAVDHPVWTTGGWKVFLDGPDDIQRTIRYIENNPVKMRLPKQSWSFVKPYDNWPLHPGHSENSPYARRLRNADKGC